MNIINRTMGLVVVKSEPNEYVTDKSIGDDENEFARSRIISQNVAGLVSGVYNCTGRSVLIVYWAFVSSTDTFDNTNRIPSRCLRS